MVPGWALISWWTLFASCYAECQYIPLLSTGLLRSTAFTLFASKKLLRSFLLQPTQTQSNVFMEGRKGEKKIFKPLKEIMCMDIIKQRQKHHVCYQLSIPFSPLTNFSLSVCKKTFSYGFQRVQLYIFQANSTAKNSNKSGDLGKL